MDPTVLAWHSPNPLAPVTPVHGAIFVTPTGRPMADTVGLLRAH